MRRLGLIAVIAVLASCASQDSGRARQRWVTTYYDRDHDGIVDFEVHTLGSGHADADWVLVDTKFRGRYDLRINFGFVPERKRVNIPVPRNVKITPGQPPFLPAQFSRTQRSNQSLQLTAGRPDASLYIMKTPPFQSTLALASGS